MGELRPSLWCGIENRRFGWRMETMVGPWCEELEHLVRIQRVGWDKLALLPCLV